MQDVLEQLKNYLSWLSETGIKEIYLSPEAKGQLEKLRSKKELLQEVCQRLGDCKRCKLYKTRHHIVFGEGPADAKLVLVGEAPGRDEDLQGRPFVGAAGQLLTRMLKSINLSRDEVYITNIIKCRPPNNRNPQPDEIEACKPFLMQQLNVIKPLVICTLGSISTHTLLETKAPISHLRGKVHDWHGIKLIPTFHPAYLLRNPGQKKAAWEDLQLLQKVLLQG
ncbi:MAG: uracil-DNA glycosylase [Candidatus Desulfofervidaceae bacterium]|nr:uracil-DNA glycosylase [Candidatus Desulfofervidaceae bacterium]